MLPPSVGPSAACIRASSAEDHGALALMSKRLYREAIHECVMITSLDGDETRDVKPGTIRREAAVKSATAEVTRVRANVLCS